MNDCIFCAILAGHAPASVVYQDERVTAFMDIHPVNPGHLLVIPNYHAEYLAEVDSNTAAHMFQVGQRMAQALRESGLRCQGVNIFMADGQAAGQEVPHAHLHVVPRFEGDGFGFRRGPSNFQSPKRDVLEETAQQVIAALERTREPERETRPVTPFPSANEQIKRRINPGEYAKIRREWMAHSTAEDRRDIPGLMATLTEDCVYSIPHAGVSWQGKAGATRFYTELLTAFPDIHFDLQNIVIGPQGVVEEAHVTGTHKNRWLNYPATGEKVEFDVIILFPWDPEREKFLGERIFVIYPDSLSL